jgi:hypothetical protein
MISWKLYKPGRAARRQLNNISEFRGRVLYANGRRPAFRLPTGRFDDPDPLDRYAYHIVAQNDNHCIGCVRNVPLISGENCLTERLLGKTKLAEMLSTFGIQRKDAVESSRWILDPNFRASRTGVWLAAGGVTVARTFGFKLLFCSVGTRDKQNLILERLGLRRVPDLPLMPAPELNDELCVMYIEPHRPSPRMAGLMDEMKLELKLRPNESPRSKTSQTEHSPNQNIQHLF